VIRTTLCCSWVAVAIAILPGAARAQPPGAVPPPEGYPPQQVPQPYPAPAAPAAPAAPGAPPYTPAPPPAQPYPPSGGASPYGPPPSPPPTYVPPTYAPPGYTPPPYSAPIYAPREITDFDDDAPVPFGYTKVSRRRKGPIIGGAVTLGVTYTFALFTALAGSESHRLDESQPDYSALTIPVVGPFIELQNNHNSASRSWLTVLGAGEATGAFLLIYGMANPRTVLVRNDQLSIRPMAGHGVSGLTLGGTF
jgi:hypothetical protein